MFTLRVRERNFVVIFFPQAHLVHLVFSLCTLQHVVYSLVHATLVEHGYCFSCKLDLSKVADIAYSMARDGHIWAAQFFNHSTRLASFAKYLALGALKGFWRLASIVM